jgi:hypothetical protein
MEKLQPILNVVLSFGFFAAVWCYVLFVLGKLGGWKEFARLYPDSHSDRTLKFTPLSARVGAVGYRNSMLMNLAHDGIHMKPSLFFRLFHPPIFLPWSEIQFETEKRFWVESLVLKLSRTQTLIRIPAKTGREILAYSSEDRPIN